MADDQLLRIIAEIEPNEASAKRTVETISRVRKSLDDARKEVAETVTTSEKLQRALSLSAQQKEVDRIGKQFADAARSGSLLNTAVRETAEQLERIGATDAQIRSVAESLRTVGQSSTGVGVDGGGSRSFGQQITSAGRALFNSPDIGPSTEISRALIGGGAVVDALDLSANQAILAFGAVGVAIGTVAAVASVYSQEIERSAENAQAFADKVAEAFEAGTTAAIQGLIDQQQAHIAVLQATAEVIEQQIGGARDEAAIALDRTSNNLANTLNQLADSFFGTQTAVVQTEAELGRGGLQTELEDTNRQIELSQIGLQALQAILGDTTVHTNDLTDALQRDVEVRINTLLRAQDMDAEATYKRIQAIQFEVNTLNTYSQAGLITGDMADELANRIAALGVEMSTLGGDLASKAAHDLTELEADLNTERDKINAKRDAQIEKIETDLTAKELEIANTRSDELAEAELKAGEARVKLTNDIETRKAKIERDFGRTGLVAIQNRDALALSLAQMKKDDDLTDLQKDGEKRSNEIDRQLADQQRIINKRLDGQLEKQRQAARAAVELARQQAKAEIDAKFAAAQTELNLLRSLAQGGVNYVASFVDGSLAHLSRLSSSMLSIPTSSGHTTTVPHYVIPTRGAFGGLPPVSTTFSANFGPFQHFRDGGDTPAFEDFVVGDGGRPEILRLPMRGRVFTENQYRAERDLLGKRGFGGSIVYAPNVSGMTPKQLREQLHQHDEILIERIFGD